MNILSRKHINQNFFGTWTKEMSYVLGYIVADGCITVSKGRKSRPFSLNITSADRKHLYKIREILASNHKISKKSGNAPNVAYQLQIRNPILTTDLMNFGILPRKTANLNHIEVPDKYFSDFVRGFFDGDGTIYTYKVNGTPQIKAGFVSASLNFLEKFNNQLCKVINIPPKNIHKTFSRHKNLPQYSICFYINDCEKLANLMYGNSPSLYLLRKKKVFEKWKLINRRHYLKQNYPSKIGWRLNQKVLT